jgi:hypothetical protein
MPDGLWTADGYVVAVQCSECGCAVQTLEYGLKHSLTVLDIQDLGWRHWKRSSRLTAALAVFADKSTSGWFCPYCAGTLVLKNSVVITARR